MCRLHSTWCKHNVAVETSVKLAVQKQLTVYCSAASSKLQYNLKLKQGPCQCLGTKHMRLHKLIYTGRDRSYPWRSYFFHAKKQKPAVRRHGARANNKNKVSASWRRRAYLWSPDQGSAYTGRLLYPGVRIQRDRWWPMTPPYHKRRTSL